jgi:hypothetical protein
MKKITIEVDRAYGRAGQDAAGGSVHTDGAMAAIH